MQGQFSKFSDEIKTLTKRVLIAAAGAPTSFSASEKLEQKKAAEASLGKLVVQTLMGSQDGDSKPSEKRQ